MFDQLIRPEPQPAQRGACRTSQYTRTAARSDSATGYRGVNKERDFYRARITENGKKKHLGCFPTAEQASAAYAAAQRELAQ